MTIRILTSTVADGSMKSMDGDYRSVLPSRRTFLRASGASADEAVLLQVVYEGGDYCRYNSVGKIEAGDGICKPATIVSDALLTQEPGQVLFLPIADCAPLVIYDTSANSVMLSHLGRHSVEQDGARKSVDFYLKKTGVPLGSLRLWLGPAAGTSSYPLWSLGNKGLHEAILEQLTAVGIAAGQIEVSSVDTTKDPLYYSHSNFLKGLQEEDGRFAVAVYIQN